MPNQYTKVKLLGLSKPKISSETRVKLAESARKSNIHRYLDPEYLKRFSESMKRAVAKYPESYGPANRGRTRKMEKHGLSFQGRWELEFYEWCIENNIQAERPSNGFKYEWEGTRTYFSRFLFTAASNIC